ncbi:fasciclin domain-containing protein [Flagellimonas sp. GZD32]|uniref:fasciclin domain-containing protein n=1 Tax=Flagellimonas cixiensis TaxID=3228750 RepID=UPI0035C8FAE8
MKPTNSLITKALFALIFTSSIVTFAQSNNKDKALLSESGEIAHHSILAEVVRASELGELLNNSGPLTIFAPSDAAFEKFSSEKMTKLINAKDKTALKSLLTYHIVAGQLTASRILREMCRGNGTASFTTVQGKKLTAHMEGYDIVLTDPVGNKAKITTADLNLKNNGVIHEIDGVILPAQM